jgi:membrane protein
VDPIARLEAYFEWLISHPVAELNRAQRWLRYAVDLTRHCSRELRENAAGQMAAALTYRTIFGLVPLLMVSMLAFRLFGDMDQAARHLQHAAYSFFNYQVDPSRPEATAFKSALDEKILDVVKTVSSLSFETIGAIGALLLIWAAIGLLVSFEDAANTIYRAPRGRGWIVRVGIYWTVLTLGPILLLVLLYAAQFWVSHAEALPLIGPFFAFLGGFGSVAGSALALVLLYKLLPNTLVKWRPAMGGAVVAAVLWSVTKWGFGLYVSRALPYLKVYGAIGLVPLFLFWLYLNWLIILFGLEIAFTLQAMRGRAFESPDTRDALTAADPQWLLPLVAAIACASRDGQPASRQGLAEELKLRLEAVAELLGRLQDEGLVVQVSRPGSDDVGLMLSLPPERIPLSRIVSLAERFTLGEKPREGPGWGALAALYDTAREAVGQRTVADVL